MNLVSRLIAAVLAALRGSWKLVVEAGRTVLRWVPGTPQPMQALPEPTDEPQPEDIAVGMKKWVEMRLTGALPQLPAGIQSHQAAWAMRLLAHDLEKVARASPDRIREHMAGRALIEGVRPTITLASETPASRVDEAREARKAEMVAAIRRSAAADARRRARWAEMDRNDAETGEAKPASLAI